MVKQKAKDVKKEVEEVQDEIYGEETISGSSPSPESDDDVGEIMEKTMGADAAEDLEENKPHTLAEEVERDEKKRRTKPEIHPEDER